MARESKALRLSLSGWILLSAACGTGAQRALVVETPVRPTAPQSVSAVPLGPTAADVMSTPVVVDPGAGLPGSDTRVNQDLTTTFQNETAMASDPADPMHLVAAWNDNTIFDPNFNLQKSNVAVGVSFDGGQTWTTQHIDYPGTDAEQLTADPAVAIDGIGNVYLSYLPYDPFRRFDPDFNQILVAKSVDGGLTFDDPVIVDAGFMDKPYLAVDTVSGNVYVFWVDDLVIYVSRSLDGGSTFSPRKRLSTPASAGTSPAPAVGPLGELFVVWGNQDDKIWFSLSVDAGQNWPLAPAVVNDQIVKPQTPLLGGFRNPAFPVLAQDRSGGPFDGRLYVVWPDQRFGDPDALVAFSDNQGNAWSAPVRANNDAMGNGADQFFPWIVVDDQGRVHVLFLDRRDDPEGLEISFYLATSTDGGATFGPNVMISDGGFVPTEFFFGDYTGGTAAANRLYPIWPDARNGDQDVFVKPVTLTDFDDDGVLNDGNGDGLFSGTPCTGGQVDDCDDNCPGKANPSQEDGDGDGVGTACDNCPATGNPGQSDLDRDGFGDACDPCPGQIGADDGDPDGDLVTNCTDNCPGQSNAAQDDDDDDGLGNACDACPLSDLNDDDDDGLCGDLDNCPAAHNPLQLDGDSDGVGNPCDICPDASDPGQVDSDGDGAGDACECQPNDPNDRRPAATGGLRLFFPQRDLIHFAPLRRPSDDAFSLTRGLISSLPPGDLGSCLTEESGFDGVQDPDLPPPGEGFFYLVQAQSFDCGLGSLGFASSELERANDGPSACQGIVHTDTYAGSEQTLSGTVSGDLSGTLASDDVYESFSGDVDHRWTLQVPPGSRQEFHVESFYNAIPAYEFSTDGVDFNLIHRLILLSFEDDDTDQVAVLPSDLSGTVIIRLTPAGPPGDIMVDELFIRTVP